MATELAAAGIDLLALRELMGHASPETTAALRASVVGGAGRRVRRRPGQGHRAMTAAVATTHHGSTRTCSGCSLGTNDALRRRSRDGDANVSRQPERSSTTTRTWMRGWPDPVDARLVELDRRPAAWLVVSFAIVAGLVRADVGVLVREELRAQHGPLGRRAVPRRRRPAPPTQPRGSVPPRPDVAVRARCCPLAVAFTGRRPTG